MAIITAILATYRLAHLLPEDEGPLFIFTRIRNFVQHKAVLSYCQANHYEDEAVIISYDPSEVTKKMLLSDDNKDLGEWSNLYRGINCVYCCGLYAAILCALLVVWNNFYGNLFLLIFALAGGQSILQKANDK